MRLHDYFAQFLTDTVNLNQTKLDQLDSRVDGIAGALKDAHNLNGRVLDIVPQGSWAHRTIIRPASGMEFDADFLVQLAEESGWIGEPRMYADSVLAALRGHSIYNPMILKKDRCVRVDYANDCHIDVVPYVVFSTGREVIINRATNEFEDTNPVGFTEWLQEKDDLTGGNLRKVLRLLKYLRDHKECFSIKSVLLTTLVGNIVESWRNVYEADYYADVPTTLLHLVLDLDVWLQSYTVKPSIVDPSCTSTSFDHRWSDAQYGAFRSKIHDLAPRIKEAFDCPGASDSIQAWRDVFGAGFPDSLARSVSETSTGSLSKAVGSTAWRPPADRARNEEFIEEKYRVDEGYRIQIECDVTDPTYPNRAARRRALRSRASHVPKQRDLLFKVVSSNVPEPFSVLWKVRNGGQEAAALDQLRGEILMDEGMRQRSESTKYAGHHYVECYAIKNGVCVARTHETVIID